MGCACLAHTIEGAEGNGTSHIISFKLFYAKSRRYVVIDPLVHCITIVLYTSYEGSM